MIHKIVPPIQLGKKSDMKFDHRRTGVYTANP